MNHNPDGNLSLFRDVAHAEMTNRGFDEGHSARSLNQDAVMLRFWADLGVAEIVVSDLELYTNDALGIQDLARSRCAIAVAAYLGRPA